MVRSDCLLHKQQILLLFTGELEVPAVPFRAADGISKLLGDFEIFVADFISKSMVSPSSFFTSQSSNTMASVTARQFLLSAVEAYESGFSAAIRNGPFKVIRFSAIFDRGD